MKSFVTLCVLALLAPRAIAAPTGPTGTRKVDYLKDIHPLLEARCGLCHLNGNRRGGLQLDTRVDILKGGESGPAAVPGQAGKSLLLTLVSSVDPAKQMPLGGPRLSRDQVDVLRTWINQGLDWGGTPATATTFYQAPLSPRRPALPGASGSAISPIDRILLPYFAAHHVKLGHVVDDRTYARRVYLDLVGLLPSAPELLAFENDRDPHKRDHLAQRLLADNENYALHWMSFWNDALRNDYAGTGYIDGGRKQITRWLYSSLAGNKPYNQFVSELVNPGPESEGFVNGIVWRGTVNASQTPQMQAAQNISQVFLGINLKCASCHDSFISNWKLKDAYGMAGIYADKPLETVRCDIPTGKIADVKFLYPELGSIDPNAPRQQRLERLAAILTSKADGRLTRTIVNRIWARLFGRGLVEPTDSMDNRPWDADLLDWLAEDLSDNGYDLKKTIARMVSSQAYQLPSAASTERTDHFVFAGPVVRRMSAEELVDAVSSLTHAWPDSPVADTGAGGIPLAAKWIWDDPAAAQAVPGERIYLRKTIDLPELPAHAAAVMSCDNEFTLYVNGRRAAGGDAWQTPQAVDLRPFLIKGLNSFAVEAINWPDPVTGKGRDVASGPNAAGFVCVALINNGLSGASARSWDFGSDATWLTSKDHPEGWEQSGFSATGWKPAAELTDAATGYSLGGKLVAGLRRLLNPDVRVRSALVNADALTTAMGRPNREQVVTSRSSAATTLQALELTNGKILSARIQQGAHYWMGAASTPSALVNDLFLESLGRRPTGPEGKAALSMVGSPVRDEGVQDLIWTLTMLPEFQLIY